MIRIRIRSFQLVKGTAVVYLTWAMMNAIAKQLNPPLEKKISTWQRAGGERP